MSLFKKKEPKTEIKREKDKDGAWQVKEAQGRSIKLLSEPSQEFIDKHGEEFGKSHVEVEMVEDKEGLEKEE